MAEIRYPKITESTPEGQLRQMKDYLHQLTNQLNFALKATNEQAAKYEVATNNSGSSSIKSVVVDDQSKKSAEEYFADLKALIIKSADIVNAYYEVIEEKLSGQYVAESDFGDYKKDVEATYLKTAEYESTFYNSIQTIEDQIGNISEIRSDFYIKTGYLDDENQIGGIELGLSKKTDDGSDVAFARFTQDELVFYGGNGGVSENNVRARFSPDGNKFAFTKFLGDVELGGYKLETKNGIAFKWLG